MLLADATKSLTSAVGESDLVWIKAATEMAKVNIVNCSIREDIHINR